MAFIRRRRNIGSGILGLTGAGLFVAFWAAMIIGWVLNIVQIVNEFDMAHLTGEIIVRIIGVFIAPIGCIYGWF